MRQNISFASKAVVFCLAIFGLSACVNVAEKRASHLDGNQQAARYSAYFKKGARQAKVDIQAGIYAVPHFFSDYGDAFIIQLLFEEVLRLRYGVDYCCLGNGGGYYPELSEFVDGYNSIAIPELKTKLQGRSLGEIYKETDQDFSKHKHEFRAYIKIQNGLSGDKELRGLNAARLLGAATR